MPEDHYEVAILGAGPAGCAAALELAGTGLKVALLDRSSFPRDKTCGDGIGPRAVQVLDSLGVYTPERFSAYQQLDGVFLTSPSRYTIKVRLREDPEVGPGFVIPRMEFDQMLLDETLSRGVEFLEGFHVNDLARSRHSLGVIGLRGGHPTRIQSDLIIVAWGSHTRLGRPRTNQFRPHRHAAIAVRAYYQGLKDIEPYMAIHFDPDLVPGYGWVFPTGPDSANIGYGMRADHLRGVATPLRELYKRFINTNPFLKAVMHGASQIGPLRGALIPFRIWRDPLVQDRLLYAGDAAGVADPLTGEGIGNALLSGRLAAQCAADALAKGQLTRNGLLSYEKRCKRILGKDLLCAAMLQGLLVRPRITSSQRAIDAFIQKAGENPRMARAMARLIIGDLPRDVILKGEVWKKLWRAWRG